jgi:hypothetical protein
MADYRDGDQSGQARGTAFFVFYEEKKLGENRGFVYLVTNRHMAEPQSNGHPVSVRRVTLRVNLKAASAGQQSAEAELPLGTQMHWYFPDDPSVDLAVIPLTLDQNVVDYQPFPVSLFATKDVIEYGASLISRMRDVMIGVRYSGCLNSKCMLWPMNAVFSIEPPQFEPRILTSNG